MTGKTMATIKCDNKKQVEVLSTSIYNNINLIQFLIYLHAYTTAQRQIIK
jgi:hypothetical protein